jgi:anaerobic selenocysteine-containing dehydrogenase
MVWVSNANPVAMLPDSTAVARALETREFTVVVDAFMTDTARCADLVLPTTTMLEDDDLVGAYGHHYLGNVRPVVPRPEGARTDHEIVRALSRRVGLQDEFDVDARVWKRRLLRSVEPDGVTLERLENGAVLNPRAAKVLFADRVFPTASGRINLIRSVEVEPPRPTAERPLLLMALSTEKAQSSQYSSSVQRGPAPVTVHPAAASGFAEGQRVVLESATGRMEVRLVFDANQRKDVALMEKGGWFRRGRCANALVPAAVTDAGGGAAYYDTPVRLLPLEG